MSSIKTLKSLDSEHSIHYFIDLYKQRVANEFAGKIYNIKGGFISFAQRRFSAKDSSWKRDDYQRFFHRTPNERLLQLDYLSQLGFISCMEYTPNGDYILVGHSTGLIQMRNGHTGTVLCTLRNIQYPSNPIYSIQFNPKEPGACYAASCDDTIYRVQIPTLDNFVEAESRHKFCVRTDHTLNTLKVQFCGAPELLPYATPYITQRSPVLSLGITADGTKMAAGYGDASVKLYDMETRKELVTYKVHKLRLNYIPERLQRMHTEQVCAMRCHPDKAFQFATGAWDKSLRIWDVRCKVGCMMTFGGVDICGDSIDLHRDQCITGSWKTTEALALWDLVAMKKLCLVRVQNRRYHVDGEYLYACRYWKSSEYNRKGKYAIVGGSGTECLEVVNLHNRYITCSYPNPGSVFAITSHEEKIAFGGSAPYFSVVAFHDPKHEKYEKQTKPQKASNTFDVSKYTKITKFAVNEENGNENV